jgi:hypothetical protein
MEATLGMHIIKEEGDGPVRSSIAREAAARTENLATLMLPGEEQLKLGNGTA